jgi:anthranilate/para-aminobenzoate synthase component II
MRVVLIDNAGPDLDLLIRPLAALGAVISTYGNDEIEIDDIHAHAPDHIIIGTGEDTPAEAGITLPVIRELGIEYPILGIGLGMVSIAAAFGARAVPSMSSVASSLQIEHEGANILAELPSPLAVVADPALMFVLRALPSGLWTTAWSDDNEIMGLAHVTLPLAGIAALPRDPAHAQRLLDNFLTFSDLTRH